MYCQTRTIFSLMCSEKLLYLIEESDMRYDFETLADRTGIGNMKGAMTDQLPGILNLSGAEMDYATAPVIQKALADFSLRGLYGFTLPDTPYLEAICTWIREIRGTTITPNMIVPTLGTVFGLCTAVRAFTAPGDGVIIQHPSYYRFDRAIERNGRTVISNLLLEQDGIYTLDMRDLEAKMSVPGNRLLVLCNPHNPTGKVFGVDDLKKIATLAARYDVVVFSDEIFAETAAAGHPVTPYIAVDPAHGITSTSLGKAFNFTGVNQANLLIPNEDLRQKYLRQRDIDHFGSVDPFFYTALRAAYSPEGAEWVRKMNRHTQANHRRICDTFWEKGLPLSLSPLEGAFVAWMDCRRLGLEDEAMMRLFLDSGVIVDSGAEYGPGGNGFVRINIATPESRISAFLTAMERACVSCAR